MNLQYIGKKELVADCPNCRRQSLVLVTTAKSKNKDWLGCKSCKMAILIRDLKKQLFTE